MNKPKRLFDLLKYINGKGSFTAKECAEEFGVSIRTIQRDLDELSSWGVPFYSEQGRSGGYRMLNKNLLPPLLFTADEAVSIYFAYKSLSYYRSLPFQVNIDSALEKFYANLPSHSRDKLNRLVNTIAFWSPDYEQVNAPLLEDIIEAAIAKTETELLYESAHGPRTHLAVPLGVYSQSGLWYAPAYLPEKDQIALFRADRILRLTHSDRKVPADVVLPSLLEWLEKDNDNSDGCHFEVRLTKAGVRLAKSHSVFQKGLEKESDGTGWIRGKIPHGEISYTSSLLLALGPEAEVLHPEELKEKMKEHAKRMYLLYH
ncbi:WYL domain-containing protein [Bacillus mangrovi]|uniref:WYL domain-containing protein n=1 Tax=Metabacillus mangrovi TaxID=1491830 RepID=A0A7X2S8W0_9BACI|nr:YafY family protein [Metabacillus mangrovi]MTH55433.1 WYL domain-containing protein [Metabacillus mangrovi]